MIIFIEIIIIISIINTIGAIITIFRDQNKDITSVWAWLLLLIMFPVFGFIVYFFVGRKLTHKKLFNLKIQKALGIDQIYKNQEKISAKTTINNDISKLMKLFLNNDEAILTFHNKVKIFINGESKYRQLFIDIKNAKSHINVEYYTIYNDALGNELIELLTQKSKEGVQVRLIYDLSGSNGRNTKMYENLRKAGGEVEAFLIPRWQLFSLNVNNHDHRKLVIIDGNVGYIGGINVGDQYINKSKKFGYWRDTHIKIEGDAVLAMQSRFFMDWNATTKKRKFEFSKEFFPSNKKQGNTSIQIVSSGPDNDEKQIFEGYLKMISTAKHEIIIQSPYFIPNQSIIDALKIAIKAGIKVKIMIPSFPDHMFVYRATEHFAKDLCEIGAQIYIYRKGFIHSKMLLIDSSVVSIGTANMDIRSFSLNFEVNAFIYDELIVSEFKDIFEQDILDSEEVDKKYFENQNGWLKFKQNFSRLFSPLL